MTEITEMEADDLYYEKRTIDSKNNEVSNPSFNTQFIQQIQPLRMVRTMGLESVKIPHTWYNISKQLETSTATINGVDILWPDDNLTTSLDPNSAPVAPQIVNYLNTQLNTAFPLGTWNVSLGLDYRLTLDVSAGAPIGTFQVTEGLGCLLGIDPDTEYDVSTDLPIVATNIIDLQPVKNIYLRIFNGATGILSNGRNQAATFDILVGDSIYGDFVHYQARSGHINVISFVMNGSNCMLSSIGVAVVDGKGRFLDLNGVGWNVVLGFRQDPKERPMPSIVGKYFIE